MSTAAFPNSQIATITLDHYEHMIERGAFTPPYNIRVELIQGKIVEKDTGKPAKFTLEHFEHMVAVGAFDPPYDIPIELLHGEMLIMSPIGPPHRHFLQLLTDWSYEVAPLDRIAIQVQSPIRVPSTGSEPEPDLVWTMRKDYSRRHPEPSEILLIVEIAESSLAYDRTVKLATYARASISEYWIVNLIDDLIEVYRTPAQDTYQDRAIYRGDEAIQPSAIPTASLMPSRIFTENTPAQS